VTATITPPEGYLPLGTLGRASGLRGELRLLPLGEAEAAALGELAELWVEGLGHTELERLRRQGRRWIVQLTGVRRRERAEGLVGARVFGPAEALPSPQGPQPGAPVERNGEAIGSVVEVRRGPQDLVAVTISGVETLLPLAAPYVRWEDGALVLIDPPEGLLP
jgi:ribosomal 30S subunit maturation factor RimM